MGGGSGVGVPQERQATGGRLITRYFGLALAETVAQNTNPADNLTGGWGGDFSRSPIATYPWFMRGGHSNSAASAGVFAFGWDTGGTNTLIGWRASSGAWRGGGIF